MSVVMKTFQRLVLSPLNDIPSPGGMRQPSTCRLTLQDYTLSCITSTSQGQAQKYPVSGFQLGVHHHQSWNPPLEAHPIQSACFHYQWSTVSFLTDMRQQVRLGSITSSTQTISTAVPQGCVLSQMLPLPQSAHLRGPFIKTPEVCRRQHSHQTDPGQ